ncbi:hypothetical protein [Variovorax sp. Root411]|jgi:hypothetical protein|uniref:hypothetical protein n=1 Tax=Variovorax sp. Root411 TaxID=1736530 RepID=UPI0006F66644|nr:hypothetical protein [Variovorax sp. Root411]KQW57078.1 hypothetical protein ASC92_12500 [Variovorax sp. Root411]
MNDESDSRLACLLTLEGYQQRTAPIFSGIHSLRWYIRPRKEQLVAAGALLYIAGRLWVNPDKFDACVLELASAARQPVAAPEAA